MNPKFKIVIAIVIVLLVLLAVPGIYLAGNFMLANSIKSNYQAKNCEQVLSQSSFYASVYPAPIADQGIAALTSECALYSLAVETEEKKAWQDAYNAYKSYLQNYPKGLFANEALEHSALVLTSLAKEQLAAKKYSDAIGNINLILKSFGKTGASKDAASLMSEIYSTWAKDQRDSSDFTGAEATLKAFKAWAEREKKTDDVKSAQRELAQTYLAWGLAFQAQKQFENAKAKFDQAISTDPEPLAKSGPAIQAKAAQIKLYTEWADMLIEKNDFTGAIERYQTVVSLSAEQDQPAAKDLIAGVYLKWAVTLSGSDDFLGALQKVDEAARSAATESAKKSVESAKSETYIAFSKSSGNQAQRAMKDAIKVVCEKNKKPDLPIFGLDKEHILTSVYGIDEKLPDTVAAKTPGDMHYVACIEAETKVIQLKEFYWSKLAREQYLWNIKLRQVNTGEISVTKSLAGGTPPAIPGINTRSEVIAILFSGVYYHHYAGTHPDINALVSWLLTALK